MGPEFVSKTTKFLIHFGGGSWTPFFHFSLLFLGPNWAQARWQKPFWRIQTAIFFFWRKTKFFEANFGSKKGLKKIRGTRHFWAYISYCFWILTWNPLGALLGPSWGPLGLSWGPFGPLLEPFWASQMDKDTQLLPRTAIFKMHCLALQISHKSTRK